MQFIEHMRDFGHKLEYIGQLLEFTFGKITYPFPFDYCKLEAICSDLELFQCIYIYIYIYIDVLEK